MTNKDLCIEIISGFGEEQLKNVVVMLQSIKNIAAEAADDAFCLQLAEDYENDLTADKSETMSIQDFSKELGIELE
ncbi:MAG: hypothetical protein FWD48_08650 [Oscillospiraceae bacterium]|nr:hypothetical protein [Oscillospiraceae bacterium]